MEGVVSAAGMTEKGALEAEATARDSVARSEAEETVEG